MKGLLILANGFEDTEAIATLDVLRRAKLEVTLAGLTKEVVSQSRVVMQPEVLLEEVKGTDYDFLIIPGGGAVFKVLDHEQLVDDLINQFIKADKLVASICAAPHLVGKNGHLENKKYTCFPGCDEHIKGGIKVDEGVVVDGKIITAKAMAYSIDFGLAIIKSLLGDEASKKVARAIKGE